MIKIRSKVTGEVKEVSENELPRYGIAPKKDDRSTIGKITDVFLSRGKDVASRVGTAASVRESLPGVQEDADRLFEESRKLTEKASQADDPETKARLLKLAREISQKAGGVTQEYVGGVEEGMRLDPEGKMPSYGAQALGAMGETAALLAPTPKALKAPAGAGLLKRLAYGGARGAIPGAIYGGTKPEDISLGERAKETAVGGTIGGVVGVGVQAGTEVIGGIKNALVKATGKTRQKLIDTYRNTLKQNIRDKNFYKQAGGEDAVVKKAIKHNLPNTKDGVIKELSDFQTEFNKKVEKALAGKKETVNMGDLYDDAWKGAKQRWGHDKTILKGIDKWFKDNQTIYKSKANQQAALKSVNKLRIKLDRAVGKIVTSNIEGGQKAAKKSMASALRMAFKDAVPELKPDIEKYHLLSGLADAMQKEPKFGLAEITGAVVLPGKGPFEFLEMFITKAIRSPGLKRKIVQKGVKSLTRAELKLLGLESLSPEKLQSIQETLSKLITIPTQQERQEQK